METKKDESLGSDTPRTVDDSHGTSSVVNHKEDDRGSEAGESPRWEEPEEDELFPSAREDRATSPAGESRSEDEDIGPAKSVKQKKRVFITQETGADSRRRKLDPEALERHKRVIERKAKAHAVVQQAMIDSSTAKDREYPLESIAVVDSQFTLEFMPSSRLSNELLEDLLGLTRNNMKGMYDEIGSPHWSWQDARKRGELRNDRMRFILVRRQGKDDKEKDLDTLESQERGIVGFLAFRFTSEAMIPHIYIHEVQVVPSWQGKGLGVLLMSAVEHIAKEASMKLLMLTVFTRNAAAMRFYERLGFHIDEASPGPCYNLLDGDVKERSPYEIMSKILDDSVLEHQCPECGYRCRFEDSLSQHQGLRHVKPFPFNCLVEGCQKGTVHLHQLHRHNEIKHGIKPPSVGVTTRRASALSQTASAPSKDAMQQNEDGSEESQQNYVNTRVMLKAEGRKGTVTRMDKGFYTVRLDGPTSETIVCRATNFEGHKYIPPKKKVIDPDHELALRLQYEDGWARKSSRIRGNAFAS